MAKVVKVVKQDKPYSGPRIRAGDSEINIPVVDATVFGDWFGLVTVQVEIADDVTKFALVVREDDSVAQSALPSGDFIEIDVTDPLVTVYDVDYFVSNPNMVDFMECVVEIWDMESAGYVIADDVKFVLTFV